MSAVVLLLNYIAEDPTKRLKLAGIRRYAAAAWWTVEPIERRRSKRADIPAGLHTPRHRQRPRLLRDIPPTAKLSSPSVVTIGPLLAVRRESTPGRGRREPHILESVEIIRREACDVSWSRRWAVRFLEYCRRFRRSRCRGKGAGRRRSRRHRPLRRGQQRHGDDPCRARHTRRTTSPAPAATSRTPSEPTPKSRWISIPSARPSSA